MTEQEQILEEISRRMDRIIRLLALNLVKDMETQKEKILTLSSFGFSSSEIAELLGTTPGSVSVTLSRTKKKKGKRISEDKAVGNSNERD
ncbi:MAG: sigma factor-like helix-turn-helix DNA-binding protein [Candidatus Methanofastidiosia archaeon]